MPALSVEVSGAAFFLIFFHFGRLPLDVTLKWTAHHGQFAHEHALAARLWRAGGGCARL